jgi:hypothetical protein
VESCVWVRYVMGGWYRRRKSGPSSLAGVEGAGVGVGLDPGTFSRDFASWRRRSRTAISSLSVRWSSSVVAAGVMEDG